MKCRFKKPTGERCDLAVLEKKKYCFLHDPQSISLLFIMDFNMYKTNDVVLGIPLDIAQNYLDKGVSLRLNRKLYERGEKMNTIKRFQ